MLHEGWGIDDVLRRHADRLASAGYLVYAPDLLGEGSWLRCIRITFKAYQARAGRPFELIESCRRKLQSDRDCTGKVGVIGFCMGGGFALLVSGEGYHAASVNYGPVPSDINKLAERSCPIVASYGGKDWMLRGHARRLEGALTALAIDHDVKEYPAAAHSFLNRHGGTAATIIDRITGISYRPADADDAWRRIFAFFDRHLQGDQQDTTG